MVAAARLRQRAALQVKKFDAAGVHPDDLKTLADLAKFPFTTKQDLRDNYPFGMFAVPREKVARIHASSGTTGKPTVVGYTLNDIDNWANLVARSIRAAGGARRPGACRLRLRPVHRRPRRALRCRAAGLCSDPDVRRADRKAGAADQDFKPDIIMVTPSYMLAIADEFERQGLNPAECSLRIGIFGAEPWTKQMRLEIERRMGIDAVDIYGLSEVMGPASPANASRPRTAR
jgi:phenylacetate-CoA ligase